MIRRVVFAGLFAASLPLFAATLGGPIPVQLPLFPGNNWWNTDITNAPPDGNSGILIDFITQPYPGHVKRVHADWGGDVGDGSGETYGIPFIIVDDSQATTTPTFNDFDSESDHVPFPIPDEAITTFGWIEGGEPGNQDPGGDRHMLIVNRSQNTLYEMGNVFYNGSGWEASGGYFFDMKTNTPRTPGFTSADAAGLAILPGLVRYDEVNDLPEINHAFRVTMRTTSSPYVFPASHQAGNTAGALPMGARLRLKSTVNPAGVTNPIVLKLIKALKRYGLIVADNGSDMFITGTYDTRWNVNNLIDTINNSTQGLGALQATDFEVITLGWQPPTVLLLTAPVSRNTSQNVTVKAVNTSGAIVTGYRGKVHFTATSAAVLPADYSFTAGDNGQHVFSINGLPAGYTSVTATDATTPTADPTITGSVLLTSGPQSPTGLVATVTSPTQVSLTWTQSANGASSYIVQRRNGANPYAAITCTAGTDHSCLDNTVSSPNAYVYRVCAETTTNPALTCSIPDVATVFSFTDDPIVAGVTTVKPAHITELQTAINKLLETSGDGDATFTAASSTGPIQAAQLQELQDALDLARLHLALPPNSRHDSFYDNTVFIKAPNVQELRDALK